MSFVIAKGGKPDIFVDDSDLGDNGRVSNPALAAGSADVTTFADSGVKRKVALRDIAYHFEGLFDSAAAKSHDALNDLRTNPRIVSVYLEGDGAGKPGVILNNAHAENYNAGIQVGAVIPVEADIVQDGVEELAVSLAEKATYAATTSEDGVDNGAASADGGSFVIHVFAFSATGGNARWIAHIQGSSDDGVVDPWIDVETITITAVGAQRVEFAGAVERYLRVQWELDATTGSLTAHGGAVRN